MTTELAQKLEGVRDFKKILETVVKELGETYSSDVSQIVLSNPLDHNITSICEYKLYPEAQAEQMPVSMSFPLPLEGSGLGAVRLTRRQEFHENEINWIRITLAELSDVIRHAQINDIVQRDTFRNTFLFEIQNVMQYSLGIGDALFMVVNILGKVLNTSRALFVCVDDSQAGWKAYEFWQRERVKSCQDYGWPTTDSPIVARSLLASQPLIVQEANQNSYLTPAQEELQLLGVRSLLGVPLRSDSATHGCIILQHCDSRHDWTRSEIDMVQNVADTVAEALAKLPDEKKGREPIMRLHQREVIEKAGDQSKESILAVRRSLRGALGNNAIPSAAKSAPPKPPVPAAPATPAPTPAAQVSTTPTPAVTPQPAMPAAETTPAIAPTDMPPLPPPVMPTPAWEATAKPTEQLPHSVPDAMPTLSDLGNSILEQAAGTDASGEDVSQSLQSLLGGLGIAAGANKPASTTPQTTSHPAAQTHAAPGSEQLPTPQSGAPDIGSSKWGDLDAIGTPGAGGAAEPNGNGGSWGNLDAIPTPAAGSARGLGGSMLGKRPSNAAAASPLLASLHKDKSKFQSSIEYIDGGAAQIDERQAEAKLKQVMSTSNATSDYIFGLSGMNPRILGRIDGWVSEVEAKDKYLQPHAVQVAEYCVAMARLLGLPPDQIDTIRLAAICHDVGKLGLPAEILQKPEDELSDNELLFIMKHPIDGHTLVEGFPELAHLAPMVLAHHEEYDGNGYPAGLQGEQIPLAARMIHIASDYHAMVGGTKRRPGMSEPEAHQALRMAAGKTYDPGLVEALIACVQQGSVHATV